MSEEHGSASLRRAADFIPQAIVVFDADLRLVVANARYSALLDLPDGLAAPGMALRELARFLAERGDLGPGDPEVLAARRVQELTSGQSSVTHRRSGGGQTLEFHSTRLPDGGYVVSFDDVTGRIAAERELERVNLSLEARVVERTSALTRVNAELESARAKADAANRDKTRFLAAASHDLLQPLNAARLYTATLIERAGASGVGELAHAIEASLNAVEDIMTALLDISRIDSGALRPAPVAFGIADLMRRIDIEFGPLARERGVRLEFVECSAAVLADRTLAGRIVQNLVSNAIKYTRPGGRVLIGCRRRGGRLRLDVIDTGIGINRDQHTLIFSEFSRLEPGARMAHGLGLGLSIVKRLVAVLGLALELESAEGRGSRFSLFLPLARAAAPAPAPRDHIETPASLKGLRIFCVDNDREALAALEGLLEHWGCEVRSVRSLRDIARDRPLEGWLPDAVLVDYHLDQTSGLDAIEWLRQNVGGHLPAALVTADRSAPVRAIAEERGVPILTKPVKPAALRAVIGGLVAGLRVAPAAAEA